MRVDSDAVRVLLELLQATDVGFVMLHREADLANGKLDSDADLAVDRHPRLVLKELVPKARESGLFLVMTQEYDSS